jgi:hypothetical protein
MNYHPSTTEQPTTFRLTFERSNAFAYERAPFKGDGETACVLLLTLGTRVSPYHGQPSNQSFSLSSLARTSVSGTMGFRYPHLANENMASALNS